MAKTAEAGEAAIAGEAKLEAHKLRADFPIFQQRPHGKAFAYLDSAVQKPTQVLDALREFYETSYTNVHRGVYLLAERATERFPRARRAAARHDRRRESGGTSRRYASRSAAKGRSSSGARARSQRRPRRTSGSTTCGATLRLLNLSASACTKIAASTCP